MSMCKYTKYTVNGHLDQCLLENTDTIDGLLQWPYVVILLAW